MAPDVFTPADLHAPYRLFVDEMQQGAATIGPSGTVLYCNHSLPALLRTPLERVIGASCARSSRMKTRPSLMNCSPRPKRARRMSTYLYGHATGRLCRFPSAPIRSQSTKQIASAWSSAT